MLGSCSSGVPDVKYDAFISRRTDPLARASPLNFSLGIEEILREIKRAILQYANTPWMTYVQIEFRRTKDNEKAIMRKRDIRREREQVERWRRTKQREKRNIRASRRWRGDAGRR